MKKLLALCLLLSCNVVQTAEKAFAAEQVEIVVVEVQRVLPLLDECKEDIEKLKRDARAQAEDIQKAKQEFGKKVQTFQTAAKTMAPKVREAKEQELQQEAMQIEQDEMNFQQEMQKNELKLQEKYVGKIRDFCRKQGWKIVMPIAL